MGGSEEKIARNRTVWLGREGWVAKQRIGWRVKSDGGLRKGTGG